MLQLLARRAALWPRCLHGPVRPAIGFPGAARRCAAGPSSPLPPSPPRRRPLRAVVALSGGVDSSVAAALLVRHGRELGIEVVGAAHMTNWSSESELDDGAAAAPLGCGVDRELAAAVAAQLGLPFHHCEFEADFNTLVFQPLVDAFRLGGSANPDCECNRVIKFDRFARHAKRVFGNADSIATGHYARNRHWRVSAALAQLSAIHHGPPESIVAMMPSLHPTRVATETWSGVARPLAAAANDQSYFLSRVRAADLDGALFPLSELPKAEIRRLARDVFELPTADRPTSTGVCFIGKRDFGTFIESHAAAAAPAAPLNGSGDGGLYAAGPMRWAESGEPVDGARFDHGKPKPKPKKSARTPVVAAQHRGVARYTVGQRILVDDCLPEHTVANRHATGGDDGRRLRKLYVARKDVPTNTLFVVDRWDHPHMVNQAGSSLVLGDVMVHDADALAAQEGRVLELVARHGQPPVPVRLLRETSATSAVQGGGEDKARRVITVELGAPIRAVCPGQVGALYSTLLPPSSTSLSRCVAAGIILPAAV